MLDKFYNTTFKKCIIIFIVIFLLITIGGHASIIYLDNVVTEKNLRTDYVVVQDKLPNNNYDDVFVIHDVKNQTYIISNDDFKFDKKLYDMIEPGKRYRMVIQEPLETDTNKSIHIVQVYNDTS